MTVHSLTVTHSPEKAQYSREVRESSQAKTEATQLETDRLIQVCMSNKMGESSANYSSIHIVL
jgi:hypothetical protein